MKVDLIIFAEAIECLSPDTSEQAIANICQHMDMVLFSSTPFYSGGAQRNVQPPEYWAGLFLGLGFIHDMDFDANYITSWAMHFRRSPASQEQTIANYERKFWWLSQENTIHREMNIDQKKELIQKETSCQLKQFEIQSLKEVVESVCSERAFILKHH
jgi:hypothetical protein